MTETTEVTAEPEAREETGTQAPEGPSARRPTVRSAKSPAKRVARGRKPSARAKPPAKRSARRPAPGKAEVARPAPTARPDARRLPTRLAKAARDTGGAVVGGAKAAKGAGGAVVGGAKVAGVAVGHAGIAAGRAAVGAGKTIASASGTVRSAIRPRRRGEAEGNAAMIRRGYRAIAKGDFVSLKGLVADDAVWHVPGRSELAADYTGPEEIAKMFLGLGERSGGTLRIDLHDVTASHDHVVALQRVRATRDGLTLDAKQVVVFHIHAGRISEAWGPVSTTQHEDDGFWGAKTRR